MGAETRRDFLGRAGAATLLAVGGALPLAAAAKAVPATRTLARGLRGSLVLPGQPGYAAAKALANPRLDVPPRAIAFCATPHDVAAVIAFARARRWPISARSGRHSFAGYGNCRGIVADVSRMRHVLYDPASSLVRIGAGANLRDVYEGLVLRHGVALPIGTCPTVGVAGLALGGGFGHLVRRAGLLCDSLVAVDLVLADGRGVRASPASSPDLFWACRGGGGGNFGVATEFTFRTLAAAPVATFSLSFAWAAAAAALDTWQRTIPPATDRLADSRFRALKSPATDGTTRLTATASGQFYGSETELRAILGPLLALGPERSTIRTVPYATATVPDGCAVAAPGGLGCTVARYPNYQQSDFVRDLLPAAAIQALLAEIERWPGGVGAHEGGVQIEALGSCAVNRVAAGATAFVHRDSLCHIVYLNFWGPGDPPAVVAANLAWGREIYAAMRPYVSGYAYQNYIDAGLADWRHAYYGGNYPRLQRIKRRYDPHDVFRFAQGITAAAAA
ncbi:MAG: FAD-binding oxidoreductase [Solirubrobacteraceae bacterium]